MFKYYTAGSYTMTQPPQNQWRDGFQAELNDVFPNSPTYYQIQEETPFASGSLANINVRVTHASDNVNGIKLGDDFKRILFSNVNYVTALGKKYYFDSNWWITVYTEEIKSTPKSITVQRCNSMLRWVDSNGVIMSEPCAIAYDLNRPTDSSLGNSLMKPEGFIRMYCQENAKTVHIKEGQRFLFGPVENRRCYQVYGNGIRNFLNQQTENDSSANLFQFIMGIKQVNPDTDDITNGIADYYTNLYTISTFPTSLSGSSGDVYQVQGFVNKNDVPVENEPLTFTSSASGVASVNSGGSVTFVSTGCAVITVARTLNPTTSASLLATVSASSVPFYYIRINPEPDYVYQGDTVEYEAGLYLNGVAQPDTFTFTVANANVPAENYVLNVIDNYSFSIQNVKQFMDYTLDIDCTSGSYTRQANILLKGGW